MSEPKLQHQNGGTDLSDPGEAGNVLTSDGTAWVSSPILGNGEGDEIEVVTVNGE